MEVGDLSPDRFYLFLLGPGYGESVLLRVPPDSWVVVDCFRWRGPTGPAHTPALEWLRAANGRLDGVLLTHPHDDHAGGMADLIQTTSQSWVGCCGPLWLGPRDDADAAQDLEESLRDGSVAHSVAAIRSAWQASEARRWDVSAGEQKAVGEATFTVLHPEREAIQCATVDRCRARPNALSSPVLVTWKALHLLLGADLPAGEWNSIDPAHQLHLHDAYKVAHHGSLNALNATVLGTGNARLWLATPWNRSTRLPRFEDGEGVDRILHIVDRLYLTALPTRLPVPRREEVTRHAILDARPLDPDLGVPLEPMPTPSDSMDGWIRIGFDAAGRVVELIRGPQAVTVVA